MNDNLNNQPNMNGTNYNPMQGSNQPRFIQQPMQGMNQQQPMPRPMQGMGQPTTMQQTQGMSQPQPMPQPAQGVNQQPMSRPMQGIGQSTTMQQTQGMSQPQPTPQPAQGVNQQPMSRPTQGMGQPTTMQQTQGMSQPHPTPQPRFIQQPTQSMAQSMQSTKEAPKYNHGMTPVASLISQQPTEPANPIVNEFWNPNKPEEVKELPKRKTSTKLNKICLVIDVLVILAPVIVVVLLMSKLATLA